MVDYKTGIWTLDEAKRRHRFDSDLASAIVNTFNPFSVADIGCGNGAYCKFFKEHGCEKVHGYEGTKEIKSLGFYNDVFVFDLTKKRYPDSYYDLIISLEVGEHIPKNFEQVYIDNLCAFTFQNLVISWAVPKQGGLGHFNERPNDYIISEFLQRGLFFDHDFTTQLREAASLKWFKNTIMVFGTWSCQI